MVVRDCTNDNETCTYQEPHVHGFACDKTCTVCAARCEAHASGGWHCELEDGHPAYHYHASYGTWAL